MKTQSNYSNKNNESCHTGRGQYNSKRDEDLATKTIYFLDDVLEDLGEVRGKYEAMLNSQKEKIKKEYLNCLIRKFEKHFKGSTVSKSNSLYQSKAIFLQKNYNWILMNCVMEGIERAVEALSSCSIDNLNTNLNTELDFELKSTFEFFLT